MTAKTENIHLQSMQARIRAINLFCGVTALLASPYLVFLGIIKDFTSMAIMAIIILLFLLSILLNKKGMVSVSRILIVVDTNFAVLYFSALFGIDSGIHLYLFTSPLIVYLLFDFKQKGKIIGALSSYLFTFIVVYLESKLNFLHRQIAHTDYAQILYGVNFCFTLFLSFVLIIYFANNNAAYNHILLERNEFLLVHQSALMGQIAERIAAEEKLMESIREKDILLSEIHHRVKNNLAVVTGLLELQSMTTDDEKVKAIFSESKNRIRSLALIHESLYQHENLASIGFDKYFSRIFTEISRSYPAQAGQVDLQVDIEPVQFDIGQAIPCGLLLNEILSNAYKYAFVGRSKGMILVKLKKADGRIYLEVKDDGVGLPPESERRSGSLGMILISSFVKQLKGTIQVSNAEGASFRISFPYKEV
jgi:two-component sensor histidine kinase